MGSSASPTARGLTGSLSARLRFRHASGPYVGWGWGKSYPASCSKVGGHVKVCKSKKKKKKFHQGSYHLGLVLSFVHLLRTGFKP